MLRSELDEEIHVELLYRYVDFLSCFDMYADACGKFQGIFK